MAQITEIPEHSIDAIQDFGVHVLTDMYQHIHTWLGLNVEEPEIPAEILYPETDGKSFWIYLNGAGDEAVRNHMTAIVRELYSLHQYQMERIYGQTAIEEVEGLFENEPEVLPEAIPEKEKQIIRNIVALKTDGELEERVEDVTESFMEELAEVDNDPARTQGVIQFKFYFDGDYVKDFNVERLVFPPREEHRFDGPMVEIPGAELREKILDEIDDYCDEVPRQVAMATDLDAIRSQYMPDIEDQVEDWAYKMADIVIKTVCAGENGVGKDLFASTEGEGLDLTDLGKKLITGDRYSGGIREEDGDYSLRDVIAEEIQREVHKRDLTGHTKMDIALDENETPYVVFSQTSLKQGKGITMIEVPLYSNVMKYATAFRQVEQLCASKKLSEDDELSAEMREDYAEILDETREMLEDDHGELTGEKGDPALHTVGDLWRYTRHRLGDSMYEMFSDVTERVYDTMTERFIRDDIQWTGAQERGAMRFVGGILKQMAPTFQEKPAGGFNMQITYNVLPGDQLNWEPIFMVPNEPDVYEQMNQEEMSTDRETPRTTPVQAPTNHDPTRDNIHRDTMYPRE
ncbi:hypothetical protein ACFL0V_03520 [Nanoarchaeota archaeon]